MLVMKKNNSKIKILLKINILGVVEEKISIVLKT